MSRRILPLIAGLAAFATGLGGGPIAADSLAPMQWGGRPLGLLLHLAAIAAVFELWRRLRASDTDAFWAATLFAVFPATSEAVLAAAGRGPQGATLLVLLGLILHHDTRSKLLPAGLALLQLLALQAHVSGLALAPLLLLHDALLVRRPIGQSLARAGGPGVVALFALASQAAPASLGRVWAAVPFMAEGIGRTLVPHTQTIAWVPEQPSAMFTAGLTAAAFAVAMGVVILRRTRPSAPAPGLFGLGWWGVCMLPLLPDALTGQAVPESGLYLGIVGPCLWLVRDCAGFVRWFTHIGRGRLARGLMAAVIVLLACRSALRAQDWRDDFLLHLAAVEDEPDNPEALYRYGTHLALEGERMSSTKALGQAYELDPGRVDIANNFAVCLMRRGLWPVAQSLLSGALERAPGDAALQGNLLRAQAKDARGALLVAP